MTLPGCCCCVEAACLLPPPAPPLLSPSSAPSSPEPSPLDSSESLPLLLPPGSCALRLPPAAAALALLPTPDALFGALLLPALLCSPSTWSEKTYVTKLSRAKLDIVPQVGSGLSKARARWAQASMPCCSAASAPPTAAVARSLQLAIAAALPSQLHLMAQWVSQGMLGLTLNRERSSSRLNVRTCSMQHVLPSMHTMSHACARLRHMSRQVVSWGAWHGWMQSCYRASQV
jgi:hypothetical protein